MTTTNTMNITVTINPIGGGPPTQTPRPPRAPPAGAAPPPCAWLHMKFISCCRFMLSVTMVMFAMLVLMCWKALRERRPCELPSAGQNLRACPCLLPPCSLLLLPRACLPARLPACLQQGIDLYGKGLPSIVRDVFIW